MRAPFDSRCSETFLCDKHHYWPTHRTNKRLMDRAEALIEPRVPEHGTLNIVTVIRGLDGD